MKPESFVLDTNCILKLLDGRAHPSNVPSGFLVSVISEMELLGYLHITPNEERVIREFLSDMRLVNLTGAVRENAIAIRQKHRIKLPDAIIAATGMAMNAAIVSDDTDFTRIAEISLLSVEEWSALC